MLHRPYIRAAVRAEVERRAERNERGEFLDANTHEAIPNGKYDLGHKHGHEFSREAAKAEAEGLSQKEFNSRMNDPNLYQIESPHENRSHKHEMHETRTEITQQKGENTMSRNAFIDRIQADKATIERCNQVSREAVKHSNTPATHSKADTGGHERGDSGPLSQGREAAFKSASSTAAEGHSTGESGAGHSNAGHSAGAAGHSGAQGTGGHAAGHGGH